MKFRRHTLAAAFIGAVILISPSLALASFDANLGYGTRTSGINGGHAVAVLRQFLVSLGLLSSDSITDCFGPRTRAAVTAFQQQQGITPASGSFAPLTRSGADALLNSSPTTFYASPISGTAPLLVTFGGTAPGSSYTLNFGDGSQPVQTGSGYQCPTSNPNCTGPTSVSVNQTHTYGSAGTYTATLTAGNTTTTVTITVSAKASSATKTSTP